MALNWYELSTKQENSPLGWETTMKNIAKAGDTEFMSHAKRFYQFQGLGDSTFNPTQYVLLAGLAILIWWMVK